jgi:hypothetical protein
MKLKKGGLEGKSVAVILTVAVLAGLTMVVGVMLTSMGNNSRSPNGFALPPSQLGNPVTISEAQTLSTFRFSTPNFLPSGTAVSEPQSYWCYFAHCDISTWPGLTAQYGGGNGIVQAGTESGLYCTVGCSYYYYGWYEFYPANSVTCSNFPVSSGDLVAADIINHAETGGSSTVYDVYVFNYSQSKTCSVTNQSFTGFTTPYYGQFITERPSFGGTPARLPKFGSVTMAGAYIDYNYCGSNCNVGISTPYGNGWYVLTTMVNGGNTNINVGSVSNNAFTQTWLTSAGT